MNRTLSCLLVAVVSCMGVSTPFTSKACTNFIVTRGASADSTTLVSYAADSHSLYGCLYKFNAPKTGYRAGTMMSVREWDTGRYLGDIPQIEHPYSTVGNMNCHSLIITETTYGGRMELMDSTGKMDYGSMIYITLQRARTAREAIGVMVELANTYGYASEGESFSIADPDEAWIMEVIGKGFDADERGENRNRGIVWVARRIPDGYVSAHANQSRITTFPLDDPQNCLYAPDVIRFAREKGYFTGSDSEFSFSDAYAPADFIALRACEARVWSFFRRITEGMDAYVDYAMGHNKSHRMPLWVKPTKLVTTKELFDAMRDHYEGTPMDMTTDLGSGGNNLPYRWRPMTFTVDGKEYVNERATATQQTGFWVVGQASRTAGDEMGILWFGVDDAATSCLTPIFCSIDRVPECLREGNGSMLSYSDSSLFWLFNRVSNFAYLRYNLIAKQVREVADAWENDHLQEVQQIIAQGKNLSAKRRTKLLTDYSVAQAEALFDKWKALDTYLLVKYIDGNVKGESAPGKFKDNGFDAGIPGDIQQPGYDAKWQRAVVEDNGTVLQVIE